MTQLDFNDMGLSGGEPIEMHVFFTQCQPSYGSLLKI